MARDRDLRQPRPEVRRRRSGPGLSPETDAAVRGWAPALELLDRTRAVLPEDYPLLLAGGVADGDDVARALAAGATAAVAGTRFLMAEESVRALHRVTRPAFARVPDGVQGWLLRPVSGLG